jgi:hypothetical protein
VRGGEGERGRAREGAIKAQAEGGAGGSSSSFRLRVFDRTCTGVRQLRWTRIPIGEDLEYAVLASSLPPRPALTPSLHRPPACITAVSGKPFPRDRPTPSRPVPSLCSAFNRATIIARNRLIAGPASRAREGRGKGAGRAREGRSRRCGSRYRDTRNARPASSCGQ